MTFYAVARLEGERQAPAVTLAAVDVLARGRPERIDEAAVAGVVSDRAERSVLAQRQIDRALEVAAEIVAINQVDVGLDRTLGHPQPRLVGDVADRSADRARSEQRALRPAQRLDAVEVEQVEVGGEQRQRDCRFVEIDPDLLLHPGLVAHDLSGGDAADRNLALPRPEVLHRQPGDIARDVFERVRARLLDVGGGLRVDRERHVLDRLVALGRGDDDVVAGGLCGGGSILGYRG